LKRLRPGKLHVTFVSETGSGEPVSPRRYTLTHSDRTGDLFLTIGPSYDRKQISGWYTRLMRDEVLAEWRQEPGGPELHLHCHVSGGIILGSARWRDDIFRHELPLVLEALRYGDQALYETHPELDQAPIRVHMHARQARLNRVESWGVPASYR
jgi:hypothetical protein